MKCSYYMIINSGLVAFLQLPKLLRLLCANFRLDNQLKTIDPLGKILKCGIIVLVTGWHIENNTWARRGIEFLFECMCNLFLTSEHSERVRYQVELEKRNSISPRIFSVVEIPIKFSSFYSYFLCFFTSRVAVLQEVPTTWTQAHKSVSSNLKRACGTKVQSCLIFILDLLVQLWRLLVVQKFKVVWSLFEITVGHSELTTKQMPIAEMLPLLNKFTVWSFVQPLCIVKTWTM